jgi:hypothetical protein
MIYLVFCQAFETLNLMRKEGKKLEEGVTATGVELR